MGWFGGSATTTRTPVNAATPAHALVPAGARRVWEDPPLWSVDEPIRVLGHVGARIAVAGTCSATDAELAALADADLDRLAAAAWAWAGTYTIVREVAQGDGVREECGRVEVVTDPLGACPIYTSAAPYGPVWASSARALADLTGASLDETWLAELLTRPQRPSARSAWAGIRMLPPASVHTLGGRTRTCPPPVQPRLSPAAAVLRLRADLDAAVAARLTGPASTDLAGLDSSTITALAAHRAHRRGDPPVTAITVHPAVHPAANPAAGPGGPAADARARAQVCADGGDLAYAAVTAAALPVDHICLPLDTRHAPYTPAALPVTDEPPPSAPTWAMLRHQLAATTAAGATVHLTGDGGDTLFLPGPAYLSELAARRRWGTLARHGIGWARLRATSPWPLWRAALIGEHTPLAGVRGQPGWITPDVPRSDTGKAKTGAGAGESINTELIAATRATARTARADAELAASMGVSVQNPYLDAGVLLTVLSVRPDERGGPFIYKPLLAAATRGLLPEPVRRRVTKGVFDGDHHAGLRANLGHVLDLADGHLAARHLIKTNGLRTVIRAAAAGAPTAWPWVLSTLAAELWLRSLQAAPAVAWTAHRAPNPTRTEAAAPCQRP